jgi:hypothetical protein
MIHSTKLSTDHVELGTALGAGDVERNNLGADEVVAGRNVSWNLEVDLAAVVVHVLSSPPLRVAAHESISEQPYNTSERTNAVIRPVLLTLNQLAVHGVVVVTLSTSAILSAPCH